MPYSLHPYQYGYSAPTLWTDPSGEFVDCGKYPDYPQCSIDYNDSWSDEELPTEEELDEVQTYTAVIGIVGQGPLEPLGMLADAADVCVSMHRGDWGGMAIGFVAFIPVFGIAGNVAKTSARAGDISVVMVQAVRGTDNVSIPSFSTGPRGVELASEELLDAVRRKGREIFQDEDTQGLLDFFHANASTTGRDISLRTDPRKIEVLEEFLHGTQIRLGIQDRMTVAEYERHVKDFMIRHRRLLGISDEDVEWLRRSKEMYE
jgi:hypothetical protein